VCSVSERMWRTMKHEKRWRCGWEKMQDIPGRIVSVPFLKQAKSYIRNYQVTGQHRLKVELTTVC
jgi:hypothetical protein